MSARLRAAAAARSGAELRVWDQELQHHWQAEQRQLEVGRARGRTGSGLQRQARRRCCERSDYKIGCQKDAIISSALFFTPPPPWCACCVQVVVRGQPARCSMAYLPPSQLLGVSRQQLGLSAVHQAEAALRACGLRDSAPAAAALQAILQAAAQQLLPEAAGSAGGGDAALVMCTQQLQAHILAHVECIWLPEQDDAAPHCALDALTAAVRCVVLPRLPASASAAVVDAAAASALASSTRTAPPAPAKAGKGSSKPAQSRAWWQVPAAEVSGCVRQMLGSGHPLVVADPAVASLDAPAAADVCALLHAALQRQGACVLVAPAGSGKSCVLRCLAAAYQLLSGAEGGDQTPAAAPAPQVAPVTWDCLASSQTEESWRLNTSRTCVRLCELPELPAAAAQRLMHVPVIHMRRGMHDMHAVVQHVLAAALPAAGSHPSLASLVSCMVAAYSEMCTDAGAAASCCASDAQICSSGGGCGSGGGMGADTSSHLAAVAARICTLVGSLARRSHWRLQQQDRHLVRSCVAAAAWILLGQCPAVQQGLQLQALLVAALHKAGSGKEVPPGGSLVSHRLSLHTGEWVAWQEDMQTLASSPQAAAAAVAAAVAARVPQGWYPCGPAQRRRVAAISQRSLAVQWVAYQLRRAGMRVVLVGGAGGSGSSAGGPGGAGTALRHMLAAAAAADAQLPGSCSWARPGPGLSGSAGGCSISISFTTAALSELSDGADLLALGTGPGGCGTSDALVHPHSACAALAHAAACSLPAVEGVPPRAVQAMLDGMLVQLWEQLQQLLAAGRLPAAAAPLVGLHALEAAALNAPAVARQAVRQATAVLAATATTDLSVELFAQVMVQVLARALADGLPCAAQQQDVQRVIVAAVAAAVACASEGTAAGSAVPAVPGARLSVLELVGEPDGGHLARRLAQQHGGHASRSLLLRLLAMVAAGPDPWSDGWQPADLAAAQEELALVLSQQQQLQQLRPGAEPAAAAAAAGGGLDVVQLQLAAGHLHSSAFVRSVTKLVQQLRAAGRGAARTLLVCAADAEAAWAAASLAQVAAGAGLGGRNRSIRLVKAATAADVEEALGGAGQQLAGSCLVIAAASSLAEQLQPQLTQHRGAFQLSLADGGLAGDAAQLLLRQASLMLLQHAQDTANSATAGSRMPEASASQLRWADEGTRLRLKEVAASLGGALTGMRQAALAAVAAASGSEETAAHVLPAHALFAVAQQAQRVHLAARHRLAARMAFLHEKLAGLQLPSADGSRSTQQHKEGAPASDCLEQAAAATDAAARQHSMATVSCRLQSTAAEWADEAARLRQRMACLLGDSCLAAADQVLCGCLAAAKKLQVQAAWHRLLAEAGLPSSAGHVSITGLLSSSGEGAWRQQAALQARWAPRPLLLLAEQPHQVVQEVVQGGLLNRRRVAVLGLPGARAALPATGGGDPGGSIALVVLQRGEYEAAADLAAAHCQGVAMEQQQQQQQQQHVGHALVFAAPADDVWLMPAVLHQLCCVQLLPAAEEAAACPQGSQAAQAPGQQQAPGQLQLPAGTHGGGPRAGAAAEDAAPPPWSNREGAAAEDTAAEQQLAAFLPVQVGVLGTGWGGEGFAQRDWVWVFVEGRRRQHPLCARRCAPPRPQDSAPPPLPARRATASNLGTLLPPNSGDCPGSRQGGSAGIRGAAGGRACLVRGRTGRRHEAQQCRRLSRRCSVPTTSGCTL